MKRFLFALLVVLGISAAALFLIAARFEARIRPNTLVGPINVGGLTKEEAAQHIREWWESEKGRQITVRMPGSTAAPINVKLSQLGVQPDDAASVNQIALSDFWDTARQAVGAAGKPQQLSLKFKNTGTATPDFKRFVAKNQPKPKPARAFLKEGAIVHEPEQSGIALDQSELSNRIVEVAKSNATEIVLPLKSAPKKVSDEQLNGITDVVSTFTTKFPIRKKDRNTNIRIASSKINGYVIPPGGRFSFNNVVGRRTIQDGFREAPVFKNGKHDMGVGGGICQVSSTLYNASLFADLKIVERHNHSMPVAYLPVGRDATVDYGSLDLVVENTTSNPIALSADYKPGALTFAILGKKDPTLNVQVQSAKGETWDPGTKTIPAPNLPAGKKKIIEKGSKGHSVLTYRIVTRNGTTERQLLGRSYYKGSQRVVAVGTKPAAPAPSVVPGVTMPAVNVPSPVPSSP